MIDVPKNMTPEEEKKFWEEARKRRLEYMSEHPFCIITPIIPLDDETDEQFEESDDEEDDGLPFISEKSYFKY